MPSEVGSVCGTVTDTGTRHKHGTAKGIDASIASARAGVKDGSRGMASLGIGQGTGNTESRRVYAELHRVFCWGPPPEAAHGRSMSSSVSRLLRVTLCVLCVTLCYPYLVSGWEGYMVALRMPLVAQASAATASSAKMMKPCVTAEAPSEPATRSREASTA